MEYKTDALVLRTADYGENDKMATLFTAERGKIGACFKGVKKAGAKLRFAAQPFCFAEYVIAERSGRSTVISASLYDGFYSLREDVNSFYAAAAVCETCDKLLFEGMTNGELLVSALTALKRMSDSQVTPALIAFLLDALRLAGYPVRAENCRLCGGALAGRMRFDMESGSFVCETCAHGVPASETTYRTIRSAQGYDVKPQTERLPDGEKRALRLLSAYITYQTDSEIASLNELIRLL